MTCRAYVQLPPYLNGIDARIDNQMIKNPHVILFYFADLENRINPDIGALKKERVDIFKSAVHRASIFFSVVFK